jgi:hypothetical protein
MRLLLIQGDLVAVYEGSKSLAVFAGATGLDLKSAEQLRLASRKSLSDQPIGEQHGSEETTQPAA